MNRTAKRAEASRTAAMQRKLAKIHSLADRMDETASDLFVEWRVTEELSAAKRVRRSAVTKRRNKAKAARAARRKGR